MTFRALSQPRLWARELWYWLLGTAVATPEVYPDQQPWNEGKRFMFSNVGKCTCISSPNCGPGRSNIDFGGLKYWYTYLVCLVGWICRYAAYDASMECEILSIYRASYRCGSPGWSLQLAYAGAARWGRVGRGSHSQTLNPNPPQG